MKWIKLFTSIIYLIVVCLLKYFGANINLFVDIILMFPICIYFVLLIHEITHFSVFALYKIPITELCIGLFRIRKYEGRFVFGFKNHGVFSGYCSFKPQENKLKEIVAALMSGGISGAIISIISLILLLVNIENQINPFFFGLFFSGTYSLYTTLLRKNSADRITITKLLRGK